MISGLPPLHRVTLDLPYGLSPKECIFENFFLVFVMGCIARRDRSLSGDVGVTAVRPDHDRAPGGFGGGGGQGTGGCARGSRPPGHGKGTRFIVPNNNVSTGPAEPAGVAMRASAHQASTVRQRLVTA